MLSFVPQNAIEIIGDKGKMHMLASEFLFIFI